MTTQFQSISGYTLSSANGSQADLAAIILAAQERGPAPTVDIDIWIRTGDYDNKPWKGRTEGAIPYLRGLLASNNSANLPHFEDRKGRLVLIIDGKQYNPVNNMRGALFAIVSFFGWPIGKRNWLMSQLFGSNNGHKNAETQTVSLEDPAETETHQETAV